MEREQLVNLLEHCSKSKYCDGCTMRYNPRFLEARSFDPELVCGKVLIRWATELIKELIEENVYGLPAKELAEKCENLSIELEAMRGAANSYKMHNKKLTEENERLRGCIKSKEEVEAIMRATYEPLVKETTKEQIDKAVTDTVREMRPAIIEEVISAVDKAFERQIYESKWVDESLEVVAFTDVGYAQECWDNCIKRELMKKFEEKKVDQIAKELEGGTK